MPRVLVPFAALLACSIVIPLALVTPFPGPHASTSPDGDGRLKQPSPLLTAHRAAAPTVTR